LETKIHEKSQVQREIEIFVGEEELQKAIDEAYKEIRPRLSLPGFRPGKAPMSLVKKMHGDAIEGDTIEKLAQEKFRSAIDELKINPIGMPVMTDLHRHEGEGAHFRIAYEVAPEISVSEFEGMEIEMPTFEIRDEDVDDRMNRLLFSQSTQEDAESVENEQAVVTLDMTEAQAEEGKEPASSKGVQVYLADPEIVPELKEKLIGSKVGDNFQIELPRGPKKEDGEVEKGLVEITVTGIKKVTLPEVTEDFAKKVSRNKVSNEADLRAEIKKELENAAEERSKERLEENIVAELLKRHDFEVPRTVTHAVLQQMVEDYKSENTRRGLPAEYGYDAEGFRKEMWPVAEARAKWVLLRDKLIEQEGLEATDEDIKELATKEASMYGVSPENLLKYYQKQESVKNRIVSEKLGTRLREKVKVTEKPVPRRS